MKNWMGLLSVVCMLGAAAARAEVGLGGLQAMAEGPAQAEVGFTGARLGRNVALTVAAPRISVAGEVPPQDQKEPAAAPMTVDNPKAAQPPSPEEPPHPEDGRFVRGLKAVGMSVAVWGTGGTVVGFFIGLLGPAAILPATLTGAMVGAGVGLIMGLFSMLYILSK